MIRVCLQSAKSDAESEIYRQLNLKIDEFFELGEFDVLLACVDGIDCLDVCSVSYLV